MESLEEFLLDVVERWDVDVNGNIDLSRADKSS